MSEAMGFWRKKLKAATFLGRLRRDARGNVLAMTAAALIPLLVMVGGAIDASRFYMARTRLQQACDAGALAGRKAMSNVTALTNAEKNKAKEFFDFNYPAATYQATNIQREYRKGADGVVEGEASLDMPTTVMKAFGFDSVELSVTCQSTLNIPNTDVMFVLDVTGSMLKKPDGSTPGTGEASKLDGLKQAVKDFYAALGPGATTGPGRVRYGFMPYSSNVNVGRILYAANPAYIAGGTGTEHWHFRSRTPITTVDHYVASYGAESAQSYDDPTTSGGGNWSNYSDVTGSVGSYPSSYSNLTTRECDAKAAPPSNLPNNYNTPTSTGSDPVTYPNTTQTLRYTSSATGTMTEYDYYRQGNGTRGTCQLRRRTKGNVTATRTSTTTRPVNWADRDNLTGWNYRDVPVDDDKKIDVSPFVQNTGSMTNPAYWSGYSTMTNPNGAAPASFTWEGCIEEAETTPNIGSTSSLTPPSDAYDLDIDLKPSSRETRWKPFLRDLVYASASKWFGADDGWGACPAEASRLTMYTDYTAATKSSANFNSYVDGLTAVGGTYHDVGLIWGSRFLSPDGIFATSNADSAAPGGYQVSRHIVFMTDGELATNNDDYTQWGINYLDGRIGPTSDNNSQLNDRHNRRVDIICNAMKAKGFTIWIIGFGSDIATLPQRLKDCASDDDHWSVASDTATLRTRFSQIAQTIGGLRLSQ